MKSELRQGRLSQNPARGRAAERTRVGRLGVAVFVLSTGCGTHPSGSSGDAGPGSGVEADPSVAAATSSAVGGTGTTGSAVTTGGGNGGVLATNAGDTGSTATGSTATGSATTAQTMTATSGAISSSSTSGVTSSASSGGGVTSGAGGASSSGSATDGTTTTGAGGGGGAAEGALLGMFTPAQSQAELAASESQVGRSYALHLGYFDWSLDYAAFAAADIAAGRVPYITVEPFNVTLDAIASGSQDSVIQSRASSIQGLGGQIMLRFAHEMNGDWYSWGGAQNGADSGAAAKYVAAYRHIHDVFAASGVTNVLWVFCPNVDSVPAEAWNEWANYYPGDSYVDWMCYDGYNWDTDTFASMTSRIYSELAAKNKPIMLGETSTHDIEKASWINAIIPALRDQFPMVRALVWFHVNKEEDWRYDSSADSLAAFVAMANDAYFNP